MPSTAKRPRLSPYLLGAVTGVVALGAILATMASSPALPRAPEADPPGVGLLQRPATKADALPQGFERLPVTEHLQDLSHARLAAEDNGQRYYLAPSTGGVICLLRTFGEGEGLVSSGTCESRSRIATSGIYLAEGDPEGELDVAIVVPDGVRAVRTDKGGSHEVANNVALLFGVSPEELRFVGGEFDGVAIPTSFEDPPAE